MLPFPDEDEEEADEEEAPRPDPNEQQRLAAKSTMEDFTRNIQRKKEREMEALQFVGGDGFVDRGARSSPAPRSGATTRALAAAARSTRSATARNPFGTQK